VFFGLVGALVPLNVLAELINIGTIGMVVYFGYSRRRSKRRCTRSEVLVFSFFCFWCLSLI